MLRILLVVTALLPLLLPAQTKMIYFTPEPGSEYLLSAAGDTVAQIEWYNNPLYNSGNDTVLLSILPEPLLPPHKGRTVAPFSHSIGIAPDSLPVIRFGYGKVVLRLFGNPSSIRSGELTTNGFSFNLLFNRYRPSLPVQKIEPYWIDTTKNCAEIYLDSLTAGMVYAGTAMNVLSGEYLPGDFPDTVNGSYLVPRGASVVFREGTTAVNGGFSTLTARGPIECRGTEASPVKLGLYITVEGDHDTSASNNPLQGIFSWTTALGLSANGSSRVEAVHSEFKGVSAAEYSRLTLHRTMIRQLVNIEDAFCFIDSSWLRSGVWLSAEDAFISITNSSIDTAAAMFDQRNSALIFRNNVFRSLTTPMLKALNCFVLFEGNTVRYVGAMSEITWAVGFYLWSGNNAVIRNNIFTGFNSAVDISYGTTAVIHNNTFSRNNTGVRISGVVDSIAVYNNIFDKISYGNGGGYAIDLNAGYSSWRDNRAWVDRNLWNRLMNGGGYSTPSVTDTAMIKDHHVVINGPAGFSDTVTYALTPSSPAVDAGAKSFRSFPKEFRILDTLLSFPGTTVLTKYGGAAPDLGAREYGLSTSVREIEAATVPGEYSLQQNHPNPFNPSTTITFRIPVRSFVQLTIYDLTGRIVSSLVSQPLPAGTHSYPWNASGLASGVYFYRLQAGQFVQTKKLAVIK